MSELSENESENENESDDTDYFGLLAEESDPETGLEQDLTPDIELQPELASNLGFEVEAEPVAEPDIALELEPEPEFPLVPEPVPDFPPSPALEPEPVPEPVPEPKPFPKAAPSPAQAPGKKPFVAKRKLIPTTAAAETGIVPEPPKKQPKKKAPAAKSKLPNKQAPTETPTPKAKPPRAKKKTARPGAGKIATTSNLAVGTAVKALLVLTCLAIAAVGYFLWQHLESPAHESKSIDGIDGIDELEAQTIALSAKIEELEGIRELQKYANEAIADGHRSALYKLDEYFNNPEIQSLRAVANAEIIRVESYFITTRQFRGVQAEMPFISESEPVKSLARILLSSNSSWPVRARAAYLLGEHPKNDLAARALVEACHTDSNLYVVQEAILSFAKVTGFRSSGVFDSRSVVRWWETNKPEAEEQP